jgi:uncharacterized protein (DUF1778 family)
MTVSLDDGLVNEGRDVNINIRVKKSQRDLIDRAAEVQGKTRTDFILDSAQKTAQEVLLDRRFFGLDDDQFDRFVAMLDEPPIYYEEMHELLTKKAPWE